MNKKQSYLYADYQRSTARSLADVYSHCSTAKKAAEKNCRADMDFMQGYDFRITSHSHHFFSCGFRYQEDGSEKLRIYTGRNIYDFIVA